jgi:hypothetical protein
LSVDLALIIVKFVQVVRYQEGGHFSVHQDSSQFHPRFLTALMYLNDIDSGIGRDGGTWFPFAGQEQMEDIVSVEQAIEVALGYKAVKEFSDLPGLIFTPKRGMVVIFVNHIPDEKESIDVLAVHAGLPLNGKSEAVSEAVPGSCGRLEKWVANYWVGSNSQLLNELLASSTNDR